MWNRLITTPLVYLYLLIGVCVSTVVGFVAANKFLLPALHILFAYPVLFSLVARGRRKRAFATMLFWALCLGVGSVIASARFPAAAEAAIFNGTSYVREMFQWIRTGEGAEGNPLQFVPQHLLHFLVFAALSVVSASLLALFMGAILMNYMAFYVGSLIHVATDPLLAAVMGWHPWSIIRVTSFVILGVILGEPLICRIRKRDYDYREVRPYLWAALGGLAIDMLIKAVLAPWWGLQLRAILP